MFIKHIYDMLGLILDAGNFTRNNTKKFSDLVFVYKKQIIGSNNRLGECSVMNF